MFLLLKHSFHLLKYYVRFIFKKKIILFSKNISLKTKPNYSKFGLKNFFITNEKQRFSVHGCGCVTRDILFTFFLILAISISS